MPTSANATHLTFPDGSFLTTSPVALQYSSSIGPISGATSGEFTGLPAGLSKVMLGFRSFASSSSSNGTAPTVRLGDATAYRTSTGVCSRFSTGSAVNTEVYTTGGFKMVSSGAELNYHGIIQFTRFYNSNLWYCEGHYGESASDRIGWTSGYVSLSSALTRIKLVTFDEATNIILTSAILLME